MEGRLRRVTEHTWAGELHGYQVNISEQDGSWYVAIMPGGQWTERVLRVDSLADGAKRARAWIEDGLRGGQVTGRGGESLDDGPSTDTIVAGRCFAGLGRLERREALAMVKRRPS